MPLVTFQRRGIWYVRGSFQGIAVYKSADTRDRRIAEQLRAVEEAKILAAIVDPEAAKRAGVRISFAAGADHYLTHGKNAPHSEATKFYVDRLKLHFLTTPIDQINQAALDEAISTIVGDDAAPATKRRGVAGPLSAILRHNARRGKCGVPDFELPTVGKSATPFFEPREALALIEAAAGHLKPLFVFLFGTGARLSEALYLDWSRVDLQAGIARFGDDTDGTKNGDVRVAALPPAVVAALASLPAEADGSRRGMVFRSDDGEPYTLRDGQGGQIKTGWATACRRAGLVEAALNPDGTPALDADGEPVLVSRFTPHACRHSWATWFYALSRNLLLLKDEGGWKTDSMVTRYAKLMRTELEGDIARVWGGAHPRIGQQPGQPVRAVQTA